MATQHYLSGPTSWAFGGELLAIASILLGICVPVAFALSRLGGRLSSPPTRQERASTWPGTCLHGHFALLSWFRVAEQSTRAITMAVDGLYGWQQPAMPEDICFFGPDDGLLFASIAHESDAWVTSARLAEALQAALGTSYFEGAA